GNKRADRTPERQAYEKTDAVLRETRRQHYDRDRAYQGADHAKPSLAKRRAEKRLAHQRGGRAGPRSVVELQPERDVESKTDGGPQSQTEQHRRAGGPRSVHQNPLPSANRPPRTAQHASSPGR